MQFLKFLLFFAALLVIGALAFEALKAVFAAGVMAVIWLLWRFCNPKKKVS